MKKLLAILLAVPCGLLCQTKVLNSPDYTAGSNTIWDMRNAVQTFPIRTVVTTLPATCTPPEQVTLQSGSSYTPEYCMSTNTWVPFGSSNGLTAPGSGTGVLKYTGSNATAVAGASDIYTSLGFTPIADFGGNGIPFRTAVGTSRVTIFSDITALWTGSGCSTSTNLLAVGGTCLPASSGGLADPGANSVVYRSSLNTTQPATYTNILSLWASCSGTQYLGADGNCHTPPSAGLSDPGSNGVLYRSALNTTSLATSGNVSSLWIGTGCSTGTNLLAVNGNCLPASSGGLADPGSNSIVYRSALNTTTPATSANVVSLFSGCSGTQYLGADGNCHTGSSLPSAVIGQSLQYNAGFNASFSTPFYVNPGGQIFGDSWMNNGGVSGNQPTLSLNNRIINRFSGNWTNYATSGYWSADEAFIELWPNVQNNYSAPPLSIIEAGVNDANSGGAAYEQNYQYTLQGMVAELAIPAINKTYGASCTPTGTWTIDTTTPGLLAYKSSTNGSTLTCTTVTTASNTTKVDVAYWAKDGNAGTATVAVDGGTPTTLNAFGFNSTNIATGIGTTQTYFDQQLTGTAGTSHTVFFTVTSATSSSNAFSLAWVAVPYISAGAPSPPVVAVYGVPYEQSDTNSSVTAAYNTIAQSVANIYSAEGLPVQYIPIRTFQNSGNDFSTSALNIAGGYSTSDAAITTGTTTLTSATANYGASVVPAGCSAINLSLCWPINIAGAGTSGGNYAGFLVGYTNSTTVTVYPAAGTTVTGATQVYGPQGSITCYGTVAPLHANCLGMQHAAEALFSVIQPMTPTKNFITGILDLRGSSNAGSQAVPSFNIWGLPTSATNPLLYFPTTTSSGTSWPSSIHPLIAANVSSGSTINIMDVYNANSSADTFTLAGSGAITVADSITSNAINANNHAILASSGHLSASTVPLINFTASDATAGTLNSLGEALYINLGSTSPSSYFAHFQYQGTDEHYWNRLGYFTSQPINSSVSSGSAVLKSTGTLSGGTIPTIFLQDSAATSATWSSFGDIIGINVAGSSNANFLHFFDNAVEKVVWDRQGHLITNAGVNLLWSTPTYTAGTNVTSVACATGYTCTNQRGELTIVGGTATTGTIATINWSATQATAFGNCIVTQNGGTAFFGIGHGQPSTASMTITAGVSVASSTVTVDYLCQP